MINYAEADLLCLRTPEYKLILDTHNPGRDEFFDLNQDPSESTNLIHDMRPEIRSAKEELELKLKARREMLRRDAQ